VGLTYFGFRYLNTALGRWASADPLTIHKLGADFNAYSYVQGRILNSFDEQGLDSVVFQMVGDIVCDIAGGCSAANAATSKLSAKEGSRRVSLKETATNAAAGAMFVGAVKRIRGIFSLSSFEAKYLTHLGSTTTRVLEDMQGIFKGKVSIKAIDRFANSIKSIQPDRELLFKTFDRMSKQTIFTEKARGVFGNTARAIEEHIKPEEIAGSLAEKLEGVKGYRAPRWHGDGTVIKHLQELENALDSLSRSNEMIKTRIKYLMDGANRPGGLTDDAVKEIENLELLGKETANFKSRIKNMLTETSETIMQDSSPKPLADVLQ
jgi:hypothetical protein